MQQRKAFTLAEILITLGIIGIIAAMTIPAILAKITEKRTVTQLKAAQSILAQALRAAEEEYGDIGGWGITGYNEESAIIIAENLKTVMKLSLDCGVDDSDGHCAPNEIYKHLDGTNNMNLAANNAFYKVVLMNGSSLYIRGGIPNSTPGSSAVFYVDTNGKAKPNTWGRDFFQFHYFPEGKGLYPVGNPATSSTSASAENSCNKSSSGYGCAYYVLHYENMNYLH